jgi:hypothetical protein
VDKVNAVLLGAGGQLWGLGWHEGKWISLTIKINVLGSFQVRHLDAMYRSVQELRCCPSGTQGIAPQRFNPWLAG